MDRVTFHHPDVIEPTGNCLSDQEGSIDMAKVICFCFEFTAEEIRQDYLKHGESRILEKIRMEKRLGNCQCAAKHPRGQ